MAQKGLSHHKKVEYIELVYDLIFVYLIKRCDDLLTMEANGFFSWENFSLYLLSTLVILQIWAYSTLYVNRYGRNGIYEYIFLILNMFLLCFLASDTRENWEPFYVSYQIAWGCIIINLAVQYFRQLRKPDIGIHEQRFLMRRFAVFCAQAAIIFLAIPFYAGTHLTAAWIALAVGYVGPFLVRHLDQDVPIHIEHLAERVMLFVVLAFGETLISAAEFFEGGLNVHTVYFAACAFLVVIGMLLAYGFIYDKKLDKDRIGVGFLYMFLHVFIVFAINDVTVGLEFMHEAESDDFRTLLFLVVSFLIFYALLLYIAHRSGRYYLSVRKPWRPFLIISAVFVAVIFCFVHNRWVNAGISAVYPYAMYIALCLRHGKEIKEDPNAPEAAL